MKATLLAGAAELSRWTVRTIGQQESTPPPRRSLVRLRPKLRGRSSTSTLSIENPTLRQLAPCRRTISLIQIGANGDVQFGGVG